MYINLHSISSTEKAQFHNFKVFKSCKTLSFRHHQQFTLSSLVYHNPPCHPPNIQHHLQHNHECARKSASPLNLSDQRFPASSLGSFNRLYVFVSVELRGLLPRLMSGVNVRRNARKPMARLFHRKSAPRIQSGEATRCATCVQLRREAHMI